MKKFFFNFLPSAHSYKETRLHNLLGKSVLHHDLWKVNRDSVSLGIAVGLFWAFIPFPAQMLFSALTALILRCNLPSGLIMCWATNPATIPFFLWVNYKLGLLLTFSDPIHFGQATGVKDFFSKIGELWLPLGVGSLVVATFCSVSGYFIVKLMWRVLVVRKRTKRSKKHVMKVKNTKIAP